MAEGCCHCSPAERALVESNRKLMELFEKKIQAKLAEICGAGE
ncbi:hypothetical protein [Candidatus Methylomirabilis sp.]